MTVRQYFGLDCFLPASLLLLSLKHPKSRQVFNNNLGSGPWCTKNKSYDKEKSKYERTDKICIIVKPCSQTLSSQTNIKIMEAKNATLPHDFCFMSGKYIVAVKRYQYLYYGKADHTNMQPLTANLFTVIVNSNHQTWGNSEKCWTWSETKLDFWLWLRNCINKSFY